MKNVGLLQSIQEVGSGLLTTVQDYCGHTAEELMHLLPPHVIDDSGNLDTAILAALVTGTVAVGTLAVTSILNNRENKKTRNVFTIKNEIMVHREKISDYAAKILALTNPLFVEQLKADVILVKELLEAVSGLELQFRHPMEVDVRTNARELLAASLSPKQDLELIGELNEKFLELMSIYDSLCLCEIEEQTSAGSIQKRGRIDDIFKHERARIEEDTKPPTWVELGNQQQDI